MTENALKVLFAFVAIWISDFCVAEERNMELTSYAPLPNVDKSWLDMGTLRLTKIKRNTFSLSGDLFLNKNLGNEETVGYHFYHKSPLSKDFSKSPLLQQVGPVCDFLKKETMVYDDLVAVSNLPSKDTCPFPKGKYTIKNYVFQSDKIPRAIPSGEYKSVIAISAGNKPVAGVEVFVTLT